MLYYIDTPDYTLTKTDAHYGEPPHLKMNPHLNEKQTLPTEKWRPLTGNDS